MNDCVRIRALPRRVGATVLRVILAALLTACIGETVNAPEGSCPSGSVRLESGCIDSARVADDVQGCELDTTVSIAVRT